MKKTSKIISLILSLGLFAVVVFGVISWIHGANQFLWIPYTTTIEKIAFVLFLLTCVVAAIQFPTSIASEEPLGIMLALPPLIINGLGMRFVRWIFKVLGNTEASEFLILVHIVIIAVLCLIISFVINIILDHHEVEISNVIVVFALGIASVLLGVGLFFGFSLILNIPGAGTVVGTILGILIAVGIFFFML